MNEVFSIFPANVDLQDLDLDLSLKSVNTFLGGLGNIVVTNKCIADRLTLDNRMNYVSFKILQHSSRGALATIAMAISIVPNESEILVVPLNSFLDYDPNLFVSDMRNRNADVGVISFQADNPTFSYLRTVNDQIVEVAEKIHKSNLATAGIFYYRNKQVLLSSIEWAFENYVTYENLYYIAPSLNYFVMNDSRILIHMVDKNLYSRNSEGKRAK